MQGADIARLLARSPGVTVVRNGPPGAFTGIGVRGAGSEQLLVLVDGIRVADTAAPSGGFDLGTLAMGQFGKVELQRSSNSTIWGSDAIGGVLSLTTQQARGFDGSVEYGGNDRITANAGVGLGEGPLSLSLRGNYLEGEGFSAAAAGREDDGFRQYQLTGKASAQLTASLRAFLHGDYTDARTDIDGFPAPDYMLADTGEYQLTRRTSGAGGFDYSSRDLTARLAYSQSDTERETYDPAFGEDANFTSDGTSRRIALHSRARLSEMLDLNFGGEREWLSYETLYDAPRDTAIWGAYAQLDLDIGGADFAIGARRDEHRDFGGEWSFGGDARLPLGDGFAATASFGEGFKAPSLFQLYSDYGNPILTPERSRSFDAGLVYSGVIDAKLVAYRRDARDLIGFDSCFGQTTGICEDRPFGTYDNISRARAQGIEAEMGFSPIDRFDIRAVYAFIDTENRDTGLRLARRPRHAGTLILEWDSWDGIALGADLRVVSGSFDDAANLVPLAGFATLDLRASWDASDTIALFGRVENLWDEDYQTAAGYGTQGRAAFIGARLLM